MARARTSRVKLSRARKPGSGKRRPAARRTPAKRAVAPKRAAPRRAAAAKRAAPRRGAPQRPAAKRTAAKRPVATQRAAHQRSAAAKRVAPKRTGARRAVTKRPAVKRAVATQRTALPPKAVPARPAAAQALPPTRGVHDVGGLPGDEPIDRGEHESHGFEKRVNALLRLLSHPDKRVMRVDELRRGIESLNETEYAGYAYYERWVESIRRILVEKGLLDEGELRRRIAEVSARFAGQSHGGTP